MDTATEAFDLIVIGSGPAGEKGAAQTSYFGKKVALVEKERLPVLGGAAANTGTLPSKTCARPPCSSPASATASSPGWTSSARRW
jgi:pyruvate/2-oxoglutarate dehydrogenase complex dihydrolipoamide dehydrogenase (E3) component